VTTEFPLSSGSTKEVQKYGEKRENVSKKEF